MVIAWLIRKVLRFFRRAENGTLRGLVRKLDELDKDGTIYVVEPWSPGSRAIVVTNQDGTTQPRTVDGVEYAYFLEVDLACDTRDDVRAGRGPARGDRFLAVLIYYAKNDAYPQ